jgi:hypothetical protein
MVHDPFKGANPRNQFGRGEMRKQLITCDHCHKEINVANGTDGWTDVEAVVKAPGRVAETFGPVDLCNKCLSDSLRNARFAFSPAPPPAKPMALRTGVPGSFQDALARIGG